MKGIPRGRDRVGRASPKAEQSRRFANRDEEPGERFFGLVRPVFGFPRVGEIAPSLGTA